MDYNASSASLPITGAHGISSYCASPRFVNGSPSRTASNAAMPSSSGSRNNRAPAKPRVERPRHQQPAGRLQLAQIGAVFVDMRFDFGEGTAVTNDGERVHGGRVSGRRVAGQGGRVYHAIPGQRRAPADGCMGSTPRSRSSHATPNPIPKPKNPQRRPGTLARSALMLPINPQPSGNCALPVVGHYRAITTGIARPAGTGRGLRDGVWGGHPLPRIEQTEVDRGTLHDIRINPRQTTLMLKRLLALMALPSLSILFVAGIAWWNRRTPLAEANYRYPVERTFRFAGMIAGFMAGVTLKKRGIRRGPVPSSWDGAAPSRKGRGAYRQSHIAA